MKANERHQQRRDDEHVQREEAGQRRAGDDRAAEQQVHECPTEDGRAAGDRGADAEPPVRVLVEAHDLAGEGHAERREEQDDAHHPG